MSIENPFQSHESHEGTKESALELAIKATRQMENAIMEGKPLDKDLWRLNVQMKRLLQEKEQRESGVTEAISKVTDEQLNEMLKNAEEALREHFAKKKGE